MKIDRAIRRGLLARAGVLACGATLSVGLLGGVAWAAPGQTFTQHAHGADAAGIVEIDFNPNSPNTPPGLSLPAGCWLSDVQGLVSTDGNGIMHSIGNKTGFWFTTTYAGDAVVLPLVLDANGNPIQDPNTGNNLVDTSATPIASGHLTTWFGDENNSINSSGTPKVDVEHATASFHGTDANGNPVSLTAHFQVGSNQFGQPTVQVGSVSC